MLNFLIKIIFMLKYVKTNKILRMILIFILNLLKLLTQLYFNFYLEHLARKLLEACADEIYEQVKIETFPTELIQQYLVYWFLGTLSDDTNKTINE